MLCIIKERSLWFIHVSFIQILIIYSVIVQKYLLFFNLFFMGYLGQTCYRVLSYSFSSYYSFFFYYFYRQFCFENLFRKAKVIPEIKLQAKSKKQQNIRCYTSISNIVYKLVRCGNPIMFFYLIDLIKYAIRVPKLFDNPCSL